MFQQAAQRLLHDLGALWLRLTFGLMMFVGHGMKKMELLGQIGTVDFSFPDPIRIGPEAGLILVTFAEALCAPRNTRHFSWAPGFRTPARSTSAACATASSNRVSTFSIASAVGSAESTAGT